MESQKPMANQPAATAAAKIKKEEKISQVRGIKTVSYTHLTLPTT